jgi:uncharacterized protein
MRSTDTTILIIPGLNGSGPGHWQRRWHEKMSSSVLVEQEDWKAVSLADWVKKIRLYIEEAPKPVVLVAHSLGVLAAHHVIEHPKVIGAFYVAPPEASALKKIPHIDSAFQNFQDTVAAISTVLVGSSTDPYCSLESARDYADSWGSQFVDAGDAGHINVESGHGPWPEGLMSFAGYMQKL